MVNPEIASVVVDIGILSSFHNNGKATQDIKCLVMLRFLSL